jgi:hypothetical protein
MITIIIIRMTNDFSVLSQGEQRSNRDVYDEPP